MKRKFIINLALIIFLNILVKPFWIFGIDRTVQNVVGAGEYGFYFSLFSFSLLFNILLDAGITNYNNRRIAREPGELSELFSNIVGLKFLLAVFYGIICFGIALVMGYTKSQLGMLLLLTLNQFLASFLLYLRSNISGLHHFRTDSLISVLDRSLVILICAALLWSGITERSFQIIWFVYAQTAAYAITVVVAFLVLLNKSEFFRPGIRIGYFIKILRQSYPFALLILLMTFYNRIDSVMLERMLPGGHIQAGIYAQSFRILDAAAMFAFLFAGLLLPIFSRMLKHNEPVGGILELSYTLIMIPAIALSVICIYYPGNIIDWLYLEHIDISSRIFPFLMSGFIAISTTCIFGTLLTANKNLRELNILAFTAVALNIILNLLLIPELEALGAAIASLVTQVYMAVTQVVLTATRLKPGIKPGYWIKIILLSLILFASGWITTSFLPDWYWGIIVLIIAAVFFSFITGLLKYNDISRILRFGEK